MNVDRPNLGITVVITAAEFKRAMAPLHPEESVP